ncbi:MAG: OmpA family protein [Bacteroidales bacterium]|nr:OmpA family protein [Bacteroidales bacterium]
MLRALLFILCLLMACPSFSQKKTKKKPQVTYSTKSKKAIALYEEGQDLIMQELYPQALEKFEAAKQIDKNFVETYFMCAEAYQNTERYREQCENLRIGIGLDSTLYITAYYQMGRALCYLGEFAEATQWLELYKKFSQGQKKRKYNADALLKRALVAKELMEHPVDYNPRLVSKNTTTDYDSYWPSLTLDEEELVYTILLPRNTDQLKANPRLPRSSAFFHEDLVLSRRIEGEWQPPVPVVNVNTDTNEGAQALSADGQWMFFTACGREDSKGSCDLYFSRRTEWGWTEPINVGAPINSPYWESQPCFSADGQTLYFVSNRPGGHGDDDIWAAKIVGYANNGVPIFGKVVNLGDSINTPGKETSPFIHADNQTLYFSSNGWLGMGGLDIFYSRLINDSTWTRPTNIGYPINTMQDENGLIINAKGDMGYWSATHILDNGVRRKELMCFDVPESARPKSVSYIKGMVYDAKTKAPLGANLELIRLDNGEKQVDAQSNTYDGRFIVNLPAGHDYALIVSKQGYLFHSQSFALKETNSISEPLMLDVPLSPLLVGEKMALRNVFFDFNSTELKEESFIELDKLVRILNENEKLRIEIGGHTDNVGSQDYNQKLSEGRARTTVQYLISKGISKQRITYKGYGFSKPEASNDTDEGRALNRRIEAKIIE